VGIVISSSLFKRRLRRSDTDSPGIGRFSTEVYVKKFAYSRPVLAAMAVVALAIELGAGHKFG
jgi:hypothetical protein